ncbi:MAG: PEP-CTERM sorting domain-containing protein [Phycisphaerales bacterium]
MNKIVLCVAALSAVAGSALAYDGVATVTQNAYSSGSGGEFTVTPTSGYLGEAGLPADLSNSSWESFCMEHNEVFSPGGSYNMNINVAAVEGGAGGPSLALDPRTAYLYWNFRMGTLLGYDYGAGRQSTAGDLQAAIWYIQGNQAGGSNNYFVALAETVIGLGGWSGIGDVRVLNVYDGNGNLAQDQLTIVPTPGAAALMGLGMIGAARRRRA